MLTIGGKHLRKRYVYPNNIIDIYSGPSHIWPYITNTIISPWNILLSASSTTISDAGGTVTLSHSTSRTITDVWVDYTGNTASCRETYTTEYATASLSTTLGSISGNTLTIPANSEYNDKTITVTASYGGANKSITITQEANKVPTIIGYGSWILSLSASPSTGISTNGGTSTITVDCYRTLTWSNGDTTYELYNNNITLSTDLGSLSYTSVSGNYGTSTLTLGVNSSTSTRTATISGSVVINGTTLTDTCTVRQNAVSAPTVTSRGEWSVSVSADPTELTSNGGTSTITATCKRTIYWSNNTTTTEYSNTNITLSTDKGLLSKTSVSSNSGTSTLTLSENTSTSSNITATITATCLSKSDTCTVIVAKKSATTITSYGEWILSISASPTYISANGGSSTITASCSRDVNWSDGTKTIEYKSGSITLSTNLGTLSETSVSSNSGTSTLTLVANETVGTNYATVRASVSGMVSKSVLISLGSLIATLTVSFEKSGGCTDWDFDTSHDVSQTGSEMSKVYTLERRIDHGEITGYGNITYGSEVVQTLDWYTIGGASVTVGGNSTYYEFTKGPESITYNVTWDPSYGDGEITFSCG